MTMYMIIAVAGALAVPAFAADCVEGDVGGGSYDLSLAITSLFVIFITSFLGAAAPCIVSLRNTFTFINGVKLASYAGSGVLLATGFVHLLLPAHEALSSPCLSPTWLDSYPAWAFLFCVITIAVMQVLEFLMSGNTTNSVLTEQALSITAATTKDGSAPPAPSSDIEQAGPRDAQDTTTASDAPTPCTQHQHCKDEDCNGRSLLPGEKAAGSRQVAGALGALVLSEASIALHSIIIGIALGITSAEEFATLFIALIFHQLLEGMALGSAAVHTGLSSKQTLFLALLFALSTPIGIAIGIALRSSFNPDTNVTSLMVTGIADSVGAGMLIFLALGEHMNALRSHAGWLKVQGAGMKVGCVGAFLAGVGAMLAIGVWA